MRMRCKICGEWWNVSARVKAEPGRYVCMVCKAEEDRAVAVQAALRGQIALENHLAAGDLYGGGG